MYKASLINGFEVSELLACSGTTSTCFAELERWNLEHHADPHALASTVAAVSHKVVTGGHLSKTKHHNEIQLGQIRRFEDHIRNLQKILISFDAYVLCYVLIETTCWELRVANHAFNSFLKYQQSHYRCHYRSTSHLNHYHSAINMSNGGLLHFSWWFGIFYASL